MVTTRQTKNVVRWQWGLFVLLQIFNLYQIINHAMWRDELQTWSMVRESSSLAELFYNMRYDGFPPLWYLCLWVLSFLSLSPLAMQLFHFACSFTAQYLVMARAPFSGNMRLAIVAGYFISFEYSVISRAYLLGMLILFLFCAYNAYLTKRPIIKGLLLGLLANSSVYGAIISLAFVADHLKATFLKRENTGLSNSILWAGLAGFVAIYGSLFFTAVSFMLPPAEGTYAAGWLLNPNLPEKFQLLCRNLICMVPIPIPKITFWNSLALVDAGVWVSVPISFLIMYAVWLALRNSTRYLFIYITGFIGIWIFGVIKYEGTVRHAGAVMLLFIACIWCAAEADAVKRLLDSQSAKVAIWCILATNLLAWGIASYYHLQYDFSGSKKMARIISNMGTKAGPIIADADYAASSVAGYLGRPLYYASNRKPQTFIRWNTERRDNINHDELFNYADTFPINNNRVVLLLNYPLESGPARLLARTGDAIVADEVFYLYEYRRK